MKKLFPVLLAMLALALATLACNVGGEPGVSNVRMTTDDTGDTATTTYASTDPFFVFFDVNAIEAGTSFESRWYALNVEGQDPNTPFKTIEYAYKEGNRKIYFQLTTDVEWPVSTYRVEIYMNGEKVGEQQFDVQ
ncbi:MAG: hypothetical protein QM730_28885 [Anaerolineales bacterium]